jgi:hypothetical protein
VLKKLIPWLIVIFVVYYIATDPDGAAGFLKGALHGLHEAGSSLSRFVDKV